MENSPYKAIEGRISFHRKEAKYHQDRAREWEAVLAQVQALERQEQPQVRDEEFKLTPLQLKTKKQYTDRAKFARELLKERSKDGITPVEVRQLANLGGFSTPTNYPYKLFRLLVLQGKARKDAKTGKYYPVERSQK